jgi:two-component system phosphate regulon sensor histidine kinase PhoR
MSQDCLVRWGVFPLKNIRSLRILELVILLFFIGGVTGLSGLYITTDLSWSNLYAGLGTLVLLLSLLLFTQRQIDSQVATLVSVASAQTNLSEDSLFTSLYDRSPVAYLTIDVGGTIMESNGAAIKLFHTDSRSLIGADFFLFMQETDNMDPSVFMSKVRAGLTINDEELSLETATGKIIWVLLSVFAYRSDGQRMVSLVDVTAQKNIDVAKSEFVALATHQLRTPIAAIRWNVELLEKNIGDTKTEAQARYLAKIERNVLRMINLINDFLSVSKLEMGTYASMEEVINVSDFFQAITDEFAEKITDKQLTLRRQDIPPQLSIKIDKRLFHITISNLISNAVKYAQLGGILEWTSELKGKTIEIHIADNGIGIPEAELPKLFTKFYRASNAQTHQTEGTGLGLYIVKQSVEQMGGSISVSSEEDKGARFVVILPANVVSGV